jgi:citrate lyase subunit beta/citryl-CoA lyase
MYSYMIKSYFFIPADKANFIKKIPDLGCDFIVFDMEESVNEKSIENCISNLSSIDINHNYTVRFPISYSNIDQNSFEIEKLYSFGFRRFTLPKIESLEELEACIDFFTERKLSDIKFDIYIETPLALLNAKEMVIKAKSKIESILIGSHDYCNILGCKHTNENLTYLRQHLLAIGKAYGINVVDIVSPNIKDIEVLKKECIESFEMGFDGKALIHPLQLEAFSNAKYFTETEVKEAIKVSEEINKIGLDKFSIVKINGKIFEKPHLKRIFEIVEWNKKGAYYDL